MTFGRPYGSRSYGASSGPFSWGDTRRAAGIGPARFGSAKVGIVAAGFQTTAFGTPGVRAIAFGIQGTVLGAPRLIQPASITGFQVTLVGQPVAPPFATPINSTRYGTPNSPYLQIGAASGIAPSLLGSPRLVSVGQHFSSSPSTTFSLAYTPFSQSTGAVGFVTGAAGVPRSIVSVISESLLCVGNGFRSTVLGTPTAPHAQVAKGMGFSATRLGWPASSTSGPLTRYGTPRSSWRAFAASTAPTTHVGTPSLRRVHTASAPATRFGTPAARPAWLAKGFASAHLGVPAAFLFGHKAYGIRNTRFAQPLAVQRKPLPAAGFKGTAVGVPVAIERHHALHIPPTARMGTPLLTRTPLC